MVNVIGNVHLSALFKVPVHDWFTKTNLDSSFEYSKTLYYKHFLFIK